MPPIEDGAVDLTVPTEGEQPMADAIDPTVRLAMDQAFSNTREGFQQAAVRHNNDANYVSITTQLQHGLTSQLVGAKAAQNIEQEGLADAILQARAAAGQPGNAPAGA